MMNLWTCRQAVQGDEILQDFQLFTFGGGIRNPNPNNTNVTLQVFLFQAYTNSQGLIENASRTYGLELQPMANVPVQKTPLPTSPSPSFSYTFAVPNGAAPDYVVQGHAWDTREGPWTGVDGYYFLNQTGELNHLQVSFEGTDSNSSPGSVSFGPNSYWGGRSEVDSWAFQNHPVVNATSELIFRTGI